MTPEYFRVSYLLMFSKFVIRNVGVLRAFDTPGSPKLSQLTLFYGGNGKGKSTLTAVLRAARDGCSNTVLARQSLGNGGASPVITLVADAGNFRFENGKWKTKGAPIEVFDSTFIADNIYAGEFTDMAHDRGLFLVIIGREGVRLATHLNRFNEINRKTAAELKAAEAALAEDKPTDMGLDEFFALAPNPDYDKRLEDAELAVKAVQQADKIAALKPLEELSVPTLPTEMAHVLASTIADIDATARDRLLEHFNRFHFDKKAEEWIGYGLDHIHGDSCPFCGREDVDQEGMVTLYGQIFGDAYRGHLATIKDLGGEVETSLGEDARTGLTARIEANAEVARKWREYARLDKPLPDMAGLGSLISDAHKGAKALIDKKRASPLDKLEAAAELAQIATKLTTAADLIKTYNEAVIVTNDSTGNVSSAAPANLQAAQLARDNIKKRIARHDAGVQKRVDSYFRARKRNERARKTRDYIQNKLKQVNKSSATHYHNRVNHYLERFSASFIISKITNSMHGNSGQVDYGLLIKGETVIRGRGRQPEAIPSFRNTLSAGDKSTLAFAFFLAMLDCDKDLAGNTVVIDDPLSSHDSHRRYMTIDVIKELCGRCRQVIVLSHDEHLLLDIKARCRGIPCEAFKIDYAPGGQWSEASVADLEALCRARHTEMIDELTAYVDRNEGDPEKVALTVRPVLETHYRRYSAYFAADQNLGAIVESIGREGSSHRFYRDLTKLDRCNNATCGDHHGEHAKTGKARTLSREEVKIIAKDALELIGALRIKPENSRMPIENSIGPSLTPG